MTKVLRDIIPFLSYIVVLLGAEVKYTSKVFPSVAVYTATSDTTMNLDETRNRFPEILRDAKLLMSEVIICDFNKDTLEVHFLLSKIFELLMEADQIGEMNICLLYTSPSPRDKRLSRMPSSA